MKSLNKLLGGHWMAKTKYTIKYTSTFINQFNNILKYFIHKLKNNIAAENFYNDVITEIL